MCHASRRQPINPARVSRAPENTTKEPTAHWLGIHSQIQFPRSTFWMWRVCFLCSLFAFHQNMVEKSCLFTPFLPTSVSLKGGEKLRFKDSTEVVARGRWLAVI